MWTVIIYVYSDGPNQYMHPSSRIRPFVVRRYFLKYPTILYTEHEDHGQTVRMRRVIRTFVALMSVTLRKHAYSNILRIFSPKNWKFSDEKF